MARRKIQVFAGEQWEGDIIVYVGSPPKPSAKPRVAVVIIACSLILLSAITVYAMVTANDSMLQGILRDSFRTIYKIFRLIGQ